MNRRHKTSALLWLMVGIPVLSAETLVLEKPEMAGISGVRSHWDRPVIVTEDGATVRSDHGHHGAGLVADWSTDKPGAPVFDAIHRGLLVRFPDAADRITAEIRNGKKVAKAELVLEFVDTEFYPKEYQLPAGMSFLGDLWVRVPPQWHAVAWALRKPWKADVKLGPTFNANVNGVSYWGRFGAQDTAADRFTTQFGPAEVSYKVIEGRMDVTAALADASFGKSLAERLRAFSDCGFMVRKWETYDARFNHGGYEYGGAPGGRGIRIKAPKLAVTLEAGQTELGELSPPADITKLPKSGQPTAVTPSDAQIVEYIERYKFKKPVDMPEWQWARIQELFKLSRSGEGGFPSSPEAYAKWIDGLLATPYRWFGGHHTPLMSHTYLLYSEAMPEPVREHLRRYWEAWLMPGRPYHELQHNQWGIWTKPENSYYARTGDWRGNHSFYRESYTRYISTMNFNHLSTMGALLGGAVINDPEALRDGRFGLEHWLLRLWAWFDGTTQESIDHYYLGLTLLSQKAFADLGPTHYDRMIGSSILLKTTDELACCYHPALRRFIASSGRTGIAYLLGINEGPNFILHTLSRRGAVHDILNSDRLGMPVAGHDLPSDQVARQALIGPWAPMWMSGIVDDKPLPFEMTATFKQWGAYVEQPLWKRSFLGRHYGLATMDIGTGNQTVPVMAQWRRSPEQADNLQDVGTLLMRYGINTTEFYDSLYHGTKTSNANGSVGTQGGHTAAFQHRNKAIVLTSPFQKLEYPGGRPIPENIHSLQSSVALANYQKQPTWRIYIDGQPMGPLPAKAKQSSRITIHDGVSFVGLIPIPATDLGRSEEVLITDGGAPVDMQGGGKAAPTLIVNSYNFFSADKPLDRAAADWPAFDRAYGGFIIETADVSEFPSFEAFQQHIQHAKLETTWDAKAGLLHLIYRSGEDLMELGYRPEYEGDWDTLSPPDRCFPYRRVNGEWPYLPPGLERDSTLSQQGRTGRLEKMQAVLTHQPGRMGYLLAEPTSGNYVFSNPLPDPQFMVMDAPGGVLIKGDGKLGMTRVVVNPKENRMDVDYAVRDVDHGPRTTDHETESQTAETQDSKSEIQGQGSAIGNRKSEIGNHESDMATALFVFGLKERPIVTLNGQSAAGVRLIELDQAQAYVIPLQPDAPFQEVEEMVRRYERSSLAQLAALTSLGTKEAKLRYRGGENYLLTEPRSGAYEFTRLWPGESAYEATVPEGVTVATDGTLALQRLVISAREARIEIDYAPYLQVNKEGQPIADRAKALLVFGLSRPPSALLHGRAYGGKVESVTLDGRQAWVVPLFGDAPAEVLNGLPERYQKAKEQLGGDH